MIGIITSVGSIILKILLLVFILGVIILIHEFGHFVWAKKFGVHIYEFSIGMGPLAHGHKGKDGIEYNLRWIPIGGYVSMAGEVYEDNDKIPKKKLLCNKPWWQRLIIMVAGVTNNFITALLLFIVLGFITNGGALDPVIDSVLEDSAASKVNFRANDRILSINGRSVNSWDKAQILLYYKNSSKYYTFEVKHEDGTKETIKVAPEVVKDGENESKVFGITIKSYNTDAKTKGDKGFFITVGNIFKKIGKSAYYGFKKFCSIFSAMVCTLWGLISGNISLNGLSGPVGMYTVVGQTLGLTLGAAVQYIIYLIAYLSVNVGLINILPFPAFDGGHVLFILIEKIKGSPVNAKIENTCHLIGFALIFLLMIIVTINDIIKLF